MLHTIPKLLFLDRLQPSLALILHYVLPQCRARLNPPSFIPSSPLSRIAPSPTTSHASHQSGAKPHLPSSIHLPQPPSVRASHPSNFSQRSLPRHASPLPSSGHKLVNLNSTSPTKVMIYHASNLAWAAPDTIEDAVHAIIYQC